jgi:hypothetical protein
MWYIVYALIITNIIHFAYNRWTNKKSLISTSNQSESNYDKLVNEAKAKDPAWRQ